MKFGFNTRIRSFRTAITAPARGFRDLSPRLGSPICDWQLFRRGPELVHKVNKANPRRTLKLFFFSLSPINNVREGRFVPTSKFLWLTWFFVRYSVITFRSYSRNTRTWN